MPIVLGEPLPAGSAPRSVLENLTDCHVRIRRYAAVAAKLGELEPGTPAQIVEAATALRRYFTEALPLHAADEDRSLAPRLVRRRDLLGALAAMSAQHREIHQMLAELAPRWRRVEEDWASQRAERAALAEGAARLSALFETHLAGEETKIFAALGTALSASDEAAILEEMRARRAPVTSPL